MKIFQRLVLRSLLVCIRHAMSDMGTETAPYRAALQLTIDIDDYLREGIDR